MYEQIAVIRAPATPIHHERPSGTSRTLDPGRQDARATPMDVRRRPTDLGQFRLRPRHQCDRPASA
jgi:hypothetical protein